MRLVNLTGRDVLPRVKSHGFQSLEVNVSSGEDFKFVVEDEVIKAVPESYTGGTLLKEAMDGLVEDSIWVVTDKFGFMNYLPTKLRFFLCDDYLVFTLKEGRVALEVNNEEVFLDFNTNTVRSDYVMIGLDKFHGYSRHDNLAYDRVYDGTLKVNIWMRSEGDTSFKPSDDYGNKLIDNGWAEEQERIKAEAEIEKAVKEEEVALARLEAQRRFQADSFLAMVESL